MSLSRNLDKNAFRAETTSIKQEFPVKKKALLVIALLSALLFTAGAETLLIQNTPRAFIVNAETSNSNTIIKGNANANVTIQSPKNETYNKNNVTFAFTIESDVLLMEYFRGTVLQLFLRHGCVIDYDTSKLVGAVSSGDYYNLPDNIPVTLSDLGNRYVGNTTLTGLSQGPHNVTVWIRADTYMISYSGYKWSVFTTVSFHIDTPPKVTVLSPYTKTYNTTAVPLEFTINEKSSRIDYSLDGQNNVTINGNTTLTWLPNGYHNVTVYATDEFGNTGVSKTTYFNVEVPFPTTLVVAFVITVAVVSVALLVYFKKRKH
jgi:hypothetical protein